MIVIYSGHPAAATYTAVHLRSEKVMVKEPCMANRICEFLLLLLLPTEKAKGPISIAYSL